MAFKPWRSWAEACVWGWNLAMRDPISKFSNSNNTNFDNRNDNSSGVRDWKDNCCWRFILVCDILDFTCLYFRK